MANDSKGPARERRLVWVTIFAKLSAIVLLVIMAKFAAAWLIEGLNIQIWPEHLELVDRAVLISVLLYIGLMAIPFLPGIELGLALMTMLGPKGILVAYVCTIIALSTSFGIGRLVPTTVLIGLLRWFHLNRAAVMLHELAGLSPPQRHEFLLEQFPSGTAPALLRHRFLILALLLNLPGNVLIGGAGGIGMIAGMSRLYSFPTYLLLISVAVLPGPILFVLWKNL